MGFLEKPISSSKTTINEKTKVLKKSKSLPPQLNHPKRSANGSSVCGFKSRIKEMGPICRSRRKYEKDSSASKQLAKEDAEFVWVFDKASQVNQDDYLWLSSGSLSPLYNVGDFKFMSPRDYSIDERLVSLLSSWVDRNLYRDKSTIDLVESTIDSSDSSLINLEGEDCKLISIVESESENLESDFPSPSYKMNSVTGRAHNELTCEILSGSVDLDEMSFDDPLIWPFGDKLHWSSTLEFFCQSPPKGLGSSTAFLVKKNGKRSRHHKELWKRRIVVASKIVEFKRVNSRNTKSNHPKKGNNVPTGKKQKPTMAAKRLRTMSMVGVGEFNWRKRGDPSDANSSCNYSCSSSMDFDASGWSVSLINLNGEDAEWISEVEEGLNSNFPSPSYKNQESQEGNILQEDDVVQMDDDDDGPLFWPYGKDENWSVALDNFNVSPRKGNSFRSRSSIRARMHDQRVGLRRSLIGVVGLSASKNVEFKRVRAKKRGKGAMKSRFGRRNLAEKMDVVMGDESMLGLGEFDGHEGVDMEFQVQNFSILEE